MAALIFRISEMNTEFSTNRSKENIQLLSSTSPLRSMLHTGEEVQSFCGRMPFLSPTSRNHLLDLILSITTKTPKQGKGYHSLYLSSLRRRIIRGQPANPGSKQTKFNNCSKERIIPDAFNDRFWVCEINLTSLATFQFLDFITARFFAGLQSRQLPTDFTQLLVYFVDCRLHVGMKQ